MSGETVLLTIILVLAIGDAIGLLLWAWRIGENLKRQTATIDALSRAVMLLAGRLGDVESQVGNTTYYMVYGRTAYQVVADVPGHVGSEGRILWHRPLIAEKAGKVGDKVRITAWLDNGQEFHNGL